MFYQLIKKIDFTFLLLSLFLLSLPLKASYNSLSFITLSVYTILVYFKTKTFNTIIFKKLFPFIFYFILVALSHFYAKNSDHSIKMITRFLPFLLFPFIFSILKINSQTIYKLIVSYIYWMTILALFSHTIVLINLINNNDILFNLFNLNYSYINLAKTIGIHSTYYALLMLMSIVFLIYLVFNEKNKQKLFFYFIILIYQSFFIFHLSTRTPIIALFILYNISILYFFINNKKVKKGILFLIIIYFFIGIMGYNVRSVRYRFQQIFGFTFSDKTHYDDGINKLIQWQVAIKANNNFVFGNSVADADASIIKSNLKHGLLRYAKEEYNAHNQFIQTYVGLGFSGLLSLFYLFMFYIIYFYRHKNFLGMVFILLFFILFQTESYLQRQIGTMLFPFIIGFNLNLRKK